MSKQHAQHNENVCNDLHSCGKGYNDWVVTTAFYSALHYVRHKIFPLDITVGTKKVKVASLDQYYVIKKNQGFKGSKHSLLKTLAHQHIGKAGSNYNKLLDWSQNARYTNYKVSGDRAKSALYNLKVVKSACN